MARSLRVEYVAYYHVMARGNRREYYGSLVDYIHLNPARAGIVSGRRGESVLDYPWSSLARGYALPAGKRPQWLAADVGMERLGYRDTTAVGELERLPGRSAKGCAGEGW